MRQHNLARRDFLKSSAAGSAGIMLAGASQIGARRQRWAWTDRMAINDAIDNLRVVAIRDDDMTSDCSDFAMDSINEHVDAGLVKTNIDHLARWLAEKPTAEEAWATIFRKPDSKEWSDVKVAIKVNCINPQDCARLAVIAAVSEALIGLGVQGSNIYIYDRGRRGPMPEDLYGGAYVEAKLPPGVHAVNDIGGTVDADFPGGRRYGVCTWLADGTIDILVNIPANKGHPQRENQGGTTLTMKNHVGSCKFSCPNMDDLSAMNQGDPIVGGTPPRQQLCIVDSLWAEAIHHGDPPSHRPNTLIMGTFGPVVDYLTVKQVREPVLGSSHNDGLISRFVTDFGYSESEIGDLLWIDPTALRERRGYDPATVLHNSLLTVTVASPYRVSSAVLRIPRFEPAAGITIRNARGRLVRRLPASAGAERIVWDGSDAQGRFLPAGVYVVSAGQGRARRNASVALTR
jgi:hypothetical protein